MAQVFYKTLDGKVIPLGSPGPKGNDGPPGPPGNDGEPGVVAATAPVQYDAATKTISIDITAFASAADGAKARSALQVGDVHEVAILGDYRDLNHLPTLGTASALHVPSSGNAAADQVVKGNDTRLSDSRTPKAHKDSHKTGGTDAITPADIGAATAAQGLLAENSVQLNNLSRVAISGMYGDLSGRPPLGTASSLNAPATGNALPSEAVKGSDTRLTNARTPLSHRTTHRTGGTDPLSPSDIGAATAAQGAKADTAVQPSSLHGFQNLYRVRPIAGRWVTLSANQVRSSNAPTQGQMRGFPVWLDAGTLDRIGVEVTKEGSAGAVLRLGIYADNGKGLPETRVLDAGTIDATILGTHEITISQVVTSGVYWLVCASQGGPTTPPQFRTFGESPLPQNDLSGNLHLATMGFSQGGYTGRRTSVAGALPSPQTAANWSNQSSWVGTPVIAVRYGEVN